ncbi:competence/damage-inducible protein A [bacterium]|nr:competence/damage-inducible protein A [FCB group bacterium]MBL7191823.1 competence/damage-inducible protein A [bacterium]
MNRRSTAYLISVGDEILAGQTVDTNSSYIAGRLSQAGIRVLKITAAADSAAEIKSTLDEAVDKAGIIILTGGLGPTQDDLTRPALAEYFGMELEFRRDILAKIKARYKSRGIPMPKAVEVQAYFPKGAEPIENKFGTAPGIFIRKNDSLIFSVPGVPREMRGMIDGFIIPLLQREGLGIPRLFRIIRTSGAGESVLSEMIGDNLPQQVEIAYLPKFFGVDLRITAESESIKESTRLLDEAEDRLRERIGGYIYGYGEEQLAEVIGGILRMRGWSIAVAESCTGGLLGGMITDIPGSSDYFKQGYITYSNEAKITLLGVSAVTLENHGAVSAETASEMAAGAKERAEVDISLAITGIAGPGGGTEDKPVGTVYIALAHPGGVDVKRFNFKDDRRMNRHRSAHAALNMLFQYLSKDI